MSNKVRVDHQPDHQIWDVKQNSTRNSKKWWIVWLMFPQNKNFDLFVRFGQWTSMYSSCTQFSFRPTAMAATTHLTDQTERAWDTTSKKNSNQNTTNFLVSKGSTKFVQHGVVLQFTVSKFHRAGEMNTECGVLTRERESYRRLHEELAPLFEKKDRPLIEGVCHLFILFVLAK